MFRVRLSIGAMWLVAIGGIALAVLLVVAMGQDPGAGPSAQSTASPAIAVRQSAPDGPASGGTPACETRRAELATMERDHEILERTRTQMAALRAEAASLDAEIARLKHDWARLERLLAETAITAARVEALRRKLQATIDARAALEARIGSHEAALTRSKGTVEAARLRVEAACAP